jgi:hypothetical protein
LGFSGIFISSLESSRVDQGKFLRPLHYLSGQDGNLILSGLGIGDQNGFNVINSV